MELENRGSHNYEKQVLNTDPYTSEFVFEIPLPIPPRDPANEHSSFRRVEEINKRLSIVASYVYTNTLGSTHQHQWRLTHCVHLYVALECIINIFDPCPLQF